MTTNDQHNKETSKKKIYIFFYSIQIRALTQNNTHMHKYTAERMTTRTYQCLRLNWILRAEDLVFGSVYRDTANARMYADVDAVPRAPHAYASYVFAPCRAALIGFSLHWRSTLAVNMVASTEHSFAVHDALFAWHFSLLHFFSAVSSGGRWILNGNRYEQYVIVVVFISTLPDRFDECYRSRQYTAVCKSIHCMWVKNEWKFAQTTLLCSYLMMPLV